MGHAEMTGLGARFTLAEEWGEILVVDSASSVGPADSGCFLVGGSHCSQMAARYIIPNEPAAVILNDAGDGKDGCGTAGLHVFDVFGIGAAAVDCFSARIGDGKDMVENGRISKANTKAWAAGVAIGMPVREAMAMIARQCRTRSPGDEAARISGEGEIPVFIADTASFLSKDHTHAICVVGSHGSDIVANHLVRLQARAAFANDAGGGKDDAGFSGLAILQRNGIPAAVYSCKTAIIGNARDAWEHGAISRMNEWAMSLGITAGMRVQDAVRRLSHEGSKA